MKGLHEYRFRDNPEEHRFADAFKRFAKSNLVYLLYCGNQSGRPPEPSERDEVVACTVIQWLGSPVGQVFLRDLGYVKQGNGR